MGHLRLALSFTVLVPVAACDGGGSDGPDAATQTDAPPMVDAMVDAPVAIDAPALNFACHGNSAPTTATPTVTFAGVAQEVVGTGISAAAGVTVKACKANCQGANDLGTATPAPTQANGAFTTPTVNTNNQPLDGYLSATKSGNWPTLLYPASPVTMNQINVPMLMVSNSALATLGLVLGINQSASNGIVGVFVTDCANNPIESGVTISITQGGTAVGTVIDAGQFSSQAAGAFIAFNVPAGNTTVNATYNSMTFRAHDVPSVAGTTTTTQVRPGY